MTEHQFRRYATYCADQEEAVRFHSKEEPLHVACTLAFPDGMSLVHNLYWFEEKPMKRLYYMLVPEEDGPQREEVSDADGIMALFEWQERVTGRPLFDELNLELLI